MPDGYTVADRPDGVDAFGPPDMSVLRLNAPPAPALPLECFGDNWTWWITETAKAAACPPDFVAAPLLASASALIGHARWPQAGEGWREPPHLWLGAVGLSGDGKTPGASCLMRDVLPALEDRMSADHPDKLRAWTALAETAKAAREMWEKDVRAARKDGQAPPLPPAEPPPEPIPPRLKVNDATIERVATLLARGCPKGLLIVRDELAGWLNGMDAYNDAGRQFWLETWNGHAYQVERQKHPEPIRVPRLAVAVYGGVQPDRLGELTKGVDDGLFARILWFWPDPLPFRLGTAPLQAAWATEALDRLRRLDMQPTPDGGDPAPVTMPLASAALPAVEAFGREMQEQQREAGGLMASALGKARGQALRLSGVLELLWWAGSGIQEPPPGQISRAAFLAAARLIADYFLPNAERVYGGAALPEPERHATRLARWIIKTKATGVHVRTLQREVRLPGLTEARAIHAAAEVLIGADWLRAPAPGSAFGQRGSMTYPVNPAVHGQVG